MAFNPQTLSQLEACGVTNAHLDLVVRFFLAQRNGYLYWCGRDGRLDHCELKLSFPAKAYETQRIGELFLPPP